MHPMVGVLLAGAALSPAVLQMLLYRNVVLDDPFITYRYSSNLIAGHGLTWNPGEPPVEGYTTFLWAILNAGGMLLGIHPLLFSKVLGAVCVVGTVLLPLSPINCANRSGSAKLLVSVLLSTCPLLAFYGVSGMEQTLFTMVTFAASLFYGRWLSDLSSTAFLYSSSALFGIAALVRPEGLGLFGIMLLFEIHRSVRMRERQALTRIARATGPFFLIWIPFYLWRLGYYGYMFPNTFYAKHTGGGLGQIELGVEYLAKGFATYLSVPLTFVVANIARFTRDSLGPDAVKPPQGTGRLLFVRYLLFLIFCYSGYVLIVGGDDVSAFPSFRLLLPIVPAAFLLCSASFDDLCQPGRASRLAIASLMLAMCSLAAMNDATTFLKVAVSPAASLSSRSRQSVLTAALAPNPRIYEAPELSRWIRDTTSPEDTIAMPWAGRVAYYTQRKVLDMLGLNDLYLAHLPKRQRGIDVKMDARYILSRAPALILINVKRRVAKGEMSFEEGGGWKLGDRELLELLSGSNEYALDETAPEEITIYRRRTSADLPPAKVGL